MDSDVVVGSLAEKVCERPKSRRRAPRRDLFRATFVCVCVLLRQLGVRTRDPKVPTSSLDASPSLTRVRFRVSLLMCCVSYYRSATSLVTPVSPSVCAHLPVLTFTPARNDRNRLVTLPTNTFGDSHTRRGVGVATTSPPTPRVVRKEMVGRDPRSRYVFMHLFHVESPEDEGRSAVRLYCLLLERCG